MKSPDQTSSSPEDFREALLSQFKSSNMLDTTRSTLRKQLLGRLHKQGGLSLEGHKPSSIQEQVMNTVFAEYLGACQRTNTLSVFLAEASLCESVHLTHDDILASLRIQPSSKLHQRIISALAEDKENGKLPRCFAHALLQSLSTASSCTTVEAGTNTDEDPAGHAATQLALLDHRFDARGLARTAPHILSQKLADLQSQCDQRVALQVAAQVDVIRETELGQAREEESSRWRHEMTQQRGELERLYTERMKHVRELEEAAVSRAHELQRASERTSFDMRQRMVAEDDRMRSTLQERERDICAREAAIEAREGSLTAREIQCVETQEDCRLRCSEAIAKVDAAKDEARRQAEEDLDKQRIDLRSQRTAFEQERARIMALHDESSNAVARLAEKDSRIEALLVSRADAEARANMKVSELHLLQSHSSRIQHELELLHQELFGGATGRVMENASPGGVPSSPKVVAGSAEGLVRLRHEVHRVAQSAHLTNSRAGELQERLDGSQKQLSAAKAAALAAKAEAEALWESVRGAQALLRDAEGSLERVHTQADEYRLALKHANTELRALEGSLAAAKAARDEAIATACVSTLTASPRASPCADMQAVGQNVSQTDLHAFGTCPSLAPESSYGAACGLSVGSSVTIISQRLDLLEMEEAELQEEYEAFRQKLLQQQVKLQQCLTPGAHHHPHHLTPTPLTLSCKGKSAIVDFAPHRSMDSVHHSIPVYSGFEAGQHPSLCQEAPHSASLIVCAHTSDRLEAIPALYATHGNYAASAAPPDPQLQLPTSGEAKESECPSPADFFAERNTSVSHTPDSPKAQSVASSPASAACTVSSQGRRSTIDHVDAVEMVAPTAKQHIDGDVVIFHAACESAACVLAPGSQPELAAVADETHEPSSRPASSTGSVRAGTQPVAVKDAASINETAWEVHVAPAIVCEEREAGPEGSATSQHDTTDLPDRSNGDIEQDSFENASDAVYRASSYSRECDSAEDVHGVEVVEPGHEESLAEMGELEHESEESIQLQIVGGTLGHEDTDCFDQQDPMDSEVESSYSFEGDDDDIEIQGINFGGVDMELLEEA